MGSLVLGSDELLKPITEAVLGPAVLGQELLPGTRRDIGIQGDRFNALFGQVGERPAHGDAQVRLGVLSIETISERVEESSQLRFQTADLVYVHAWPSVTWWEGSVSFVAAVKTSSS
jgi:hypothetical protein